MYVRHSLHHRPFLIQEIFRFIIVSVYKKFNDSETFEFTIDFDFQFL